MKKFKINKTECDIKAFEKIRINYEKFLISFVRFCPPLHGYIANTQRTGVQHIQSLYIRMFFRASFHIPFALIENVRNILMNRFVLPKVCVFLTTRCTLNCEKCGALVPFFEKTKDVSADKILKDIDALVASVDCIYSLNLAGGEPFIHKQIGIIINSLINYNKIKYIHITTNGTVIPDKNLLSLLRHPKIRIHISSYPKELVKNVDKVISIFEEKKIAYDYVGIQPWKDFGSWNKIDDNLAAERYNLCYYSLSCGLYDGKLHMCTISAMGMASGIIPKNKSDYVNLRRGSADKIRVQLKKLLKKREISACSYCYGDTYRTVNIPPAIQTTYRRSKIIKTGDEL